MAMYRMIAEALPALRLEPADEIVRRQRIVKSPAEQALLRRAAEVSDAGLRAALGRVREGATETDVCAHGIAAAMEAGADFVRYLRVHSGVYSSYGSRWPQALPRTMERGDLVAMDIIGAADGYQFDVLRTTAAGAPDAEHRKVLDAVVHAADAAVAAARAGAVCGDLVRTANRLLDEAGYGKHARTFMGHGIGLETVEEPYLTPEITARLEPGMVICVEPGVYIPGWAGASVEHELIVTEGPPEVITPTPARQW
jgi:Xaa-Pro aminopeptidase/Xaa-Pro dipeptidase